ncbi:oligosaccharide flippase family protein [Clostridium polynesiense]|uniref:oligosaccharide flippase family protein n=1 Tax=Clostridium polynesiense TaxID=1325933 RepID=UPI000AE13C85|nr:oligosaccharide flippase family protein [Clostridium polynesiense]
MKNVIFKVMLSAFNIIVPIIIGPYALSVLGKDLMSDIYFADTIYNYFYIFAAFGIYQYGLREVSRVRQNKEKLSKIFTSLFVIGCITNILSLVVYLATAFTFYKNNSVFPVLIIYTLNIFSNVFFIEWVNEALENYDFITMKTILVRFTYIVLLLVLVKTSKDFTTYILLGSFYLFFNNFISYLYIKRRIKFDFKGIEIKRHIKYLIMGVVLANANILYTQLDKFMLGTFIDKTLVTYYAIPQMIGYVINSMILAIIYVTIPRLSNYLANDDTETYESLLNRVVRVYFSLLFPVALGIFVIAPEIITIYSYGKEDISMAIPVLKLFALYIVTGGIESILTNQVIYVKRKEKTLVKFIFLCGILNAVLNILLVVMGVFNAETAIITTIIANGLLIILEYRYVKKTLNVKLNMFTMDKMKYLLISLIFIPVTAVIKYFVHSMALYTILVILINSALYFVILLKMKDEVLFMILDKLLSKIRRVK